MNDREPSCLLLYGARTARAVTEHDARVCPRRPIVPNEDLSATQTFALVGDALEWTITLANTGSRPVEIGDLAVPFNFAERTGARGDIYTRKLLRHSYVSGHGSWIYWQRSNGAGPYLVMTPMDQAKFEFQDSNGTAAGFGGAYTPYVHAKAAAAAAIAAGGKWRLPVTSLTLEPKGGKASSVTYTFRFQWARDFAAVRDVLHAEAQDAAVAGSRNNANMSTPADGTSPRMQMYL